LAARQLPRPSAEIVYEEDSLERLIVAHNGRTISCPNRQVCDVLHGGPTAKRLAIFLQCEGDAIGPLRHFVRRGDLVAIRGEADMASPPQSGRL